MSLFTARRAGALLRSVATFGLLTALRIGPAGVAGWALKSVSRRPLKMLIAVALEPALQRVAKRLAARVSTRHYGA